MSGGRVVSLVQTNFGFHIAEIILLVTLVIFGIVLLVPYAATPNASACSDGNQCMVPWLTGSPAYCRREPAPMTKRCSSSCHASGTAAHCDGAGACVAEDPNACKGFCPWTDTEGFVYAPSAKCTGDLFPLQGYWQNWALLYAAPFNYGDYAFQSDWGFGPNSSLADNLLSCYAQTCTMSLLQLNAWLVTEECEGPCWFPQTSLGSVTCNALLNASNGVVDTSCIQAAETRLDSTFLDTWFNDMFEASFEGATGRLCTYWYACAPQNQSVYGDPINLAPNILSLGASQYNVSKRSAAVASALSKPFGNTPPGHPAAAHTLLSLLNQHVPHVERVFKTARRK
jgi:hypothetical protein